MSYLCTIFKLGFAERLALGSADYIEVALRRIYEWRARTD
jgi:hypothetical protein